MPAHDPLYDLVLMLDSAAPDDQRQKVLDGVESTIVAAGEIVNSQDWGVRQTAYEIRHKTDAEYHLLQFHATREVLESLQRTLRITDGVVRFRIIKLAPGTPAPPANRPEPRPTGIGETVATEAPTPAAAPADALA
jgi:small subunit ribosomal protein S6